MAEAARLGEDEDPLQTLRLSRGGAAQ
jgi:hypothetical protein